MPYSCEGCLGDLPVDPTDPTSGGSDYTPSVTGGSTVYAPASSGVVLPSGVSWLVNPQATPTPQYLPDLVANVAPATAGLPWWGIAVLLGIAAIGLSGSKGQKGWF